MALLVICGLCAYLERHLEVWPSHLLILVRNVTSADRLDRRISDELLKRQYANMFSSNERRALARSFVSQCVGGRSMLRVDRRDDGVFRISPSRAFIEGPLVNSIVYVIVEPGHRVIEQWPLIAWSERVTFPRRDPVSIGLRAGEGLVLEVRWFPSPDSKEADGIVLASASMPLSGDMR